MRRPSPRRVSLVLPVGSAPGRAAALQIVVHLLRSMRVELDLLRGAAAEEAGVAVQPGGPGAFVFVTATSDAENGRPVSDPEFEVELRVRIERGYARVGIPDVDYELEIL